MRGWIARHVVGPALGDTVALPRGAHWSSGPSACKPGTAGGAGPGKPQRMPPRADTHAHLGPARWAAKCCHTSATTMSGCGFERMGLRPARGGFLRASQPLRTSVRRTCQRGTVELHPPALSACAIGGQPSGACSHVTCVAPRHRGQPAPRVRHRAPGPGSGTITASSAPPKRSAFLSFSPPTIGEEEIREVVDTLRSHWISTGPKTRRFEEEFAAYLRAPGAFALNSCTAEQHTALKALGLRPADEVITTPMTFSASMNVIEHVG